MRAAAGIAGVAPYFLYRVKKRDEGFAADWTEALAVGRASLVAERGRRVTQKKRIRRRQWQPEDSVRAVAVAAETGSLKSVAARTGFCADTVRKQRRGAPGFDAAIRAALAEATNRLEAELLDQASEAMAVPGSAGATGPGGKAVVDFGQALELVKHRRAVEAREARGAARDPSRFAPPQPSIEEVRERVKAQLAAMRRERGEE